MLKIADSAMIRHHMPTLPLILGDSGRSLCAMVMFVAVNETLPRLLVFPIRIFGMFQVPQGTTAPDYRNFRVVVLRRRRSSGPFERPSIPGITTGNVALKIRAHHIDYPHQHAQYLEDHAAGNDEVPKLPAPAGLIGINASRHAQQARNVHEVESQVKTDQEKPKMPSA